MFVEVVGVVFVEVMGVGVSCVSCLWRWWVLCVVFVEVVGVVFVEVVGVV